ncbi:reticulon-2a isoform X3 [Nerophis ophidion]|uniref:reticulon-2a isoform X3 n=1 Tax=Nerophis ophidion TaxID=159077 RepID=UPI002ADF0817|nr:reticulon-2a isoform X3 [Nerophis ophidion]
MSRCSDDQAARLLPAAAMVMMMMMMMMMRASSRTKRMAEGGVWTESGRGGQRQEAAHADHRGTTEAAEEYGSVASTPDSTPPCTDGGNEESELYELQTAREWLEDEDGGYDDDDTLASSPSVWGTPRQSSLEPTFSYIAIAEPEALGASRSHRDRRRVSSRGSRSSIARTDTPDTSLDSPDVDWDPEGFLSNEHEEASESSEQERVEMRTLSPRRRRERPAETVTMQPCPQSVEADAGIQSQERCSIQTGSLPLASSQTQILPAETTTSAPMPESPVAEENAAEESPRPTDPMSSSPAVVTQTTQEQPCQNSSFDPSESPHIAETVSLGIRNDQLIVWNVFLAWEEVVKTHVMDLIYWKDTERTGIVLTGLVVVLLSLFQLSVITVVSTLSLIIMCVTIPVRVYYRILYTLNWGDGVHPFKSYLDMDISLSGEHADLVMQKLIVMTLSAVDSLKRLVFVGNLFDSLKLLFLLYLVTYIGDLCNGLTLLIIGVIALFSLPLFYRQRQEQVDRVIAKIQAQIDNIKDFLQRLAQGGGPPPDTTPSVAKPEGQ